MDLLLHYILCVRPYGTWVTYAKIDFVCLIGANGASYKKWYTKGAGNPLLLTLFGQGGEHIAGFRHSRGRIEALENNSWDQETPGLLLICNNMELLQLQGSFGFDDGTIEECMTIDDYARFESFETYDFITVNYFFYEGEKLIFEEIDLYIGTDYLVLILNNEQLRSELLARLQKRTQGPRRATHNYLYYLVFDFILDQMFQTLENLEDQLEDLEMDILVYAAKEKFNRIIELKAQVNLLKNMFGL